MVDPKLLIVPKVVPSVIAPKKRKMVSLEGIEGSRVDARNYRGNGHWNFDLPMAKGKQMGFVYAIRNKLNSRMYIGKKQYRSTGKITKHQESNWSWYISSSIELSADIKLYGKDNFDFIVLEEYVSKGGLSYAEVWSLIVCEVNCKPELWYNRLINKVAWIVKEPPTKKHRERLEAFVKGEL